MNMQAVLFLVDDARHKADAGVDYSVKYGGVCPVCATDHLPVITSRAWKGNVKIRFHKCNNADCILSRMGVSIKSVQVSDE